MLTTSCNLPWTQSEWGNTWEWLITYDGSWFSMSIPDTWNIWSWKNLPTPKKWTLLLSAISPEIRYWFSSNIIILEDSLNTPVTSKKYSEMNHIQTTKNYLEYTKLWDEPILFQDADESQAYIFEARYNTTTNRIKFIQTAKICGTKIYLLHAAIALDKDAENYIKLFKTFVCQ